MGTATEAASLRERRVAIVAGRIAPVLAIVDLDMHVLGWSPNSGAADLIAGAGSELRHAARTCYARGEQIVYSLDDYVILRIVPLESGQANCVAVLIESFGHRGSIDKAAAAYRLTRREREILGYVAQGLSNAEIADYLYIAHSTVADHIKSLMRKTHTTKRIHLLSKIYYGSPA